MEKRNYCQAIAFASGEESKIINYHRESRVTSILHHLVLLAAE